MNNNIFSVTVFMSTYNGGKYVKEQIESILNQVGVEIKLLIRDDGSQDDTVSIIQSINDSRVKLILGSNVGFIKSFLSLIKEGRGTSYYAFSDQDDVWDCDKLLCACSMLKEYDSIPAIYSSNTRLVTADRHIIFDEEKQVIEGLHAAIIKNYVTGCTVVFNDKLKTTIQNINPNLLSSHDWWINVVCLAVGGISIFDETPHMDYRQHQNNTVGATKKGFKKYYSWIKKFFSKKYERDKMCEEILEQFGKYINENNKLVLGQMANYRVNKQSIIFNQKWRTAGIIENLGFIISVLFNRV